MTRWMVAGLAMMWFGGAMAADAPPTDAPNEQAPNEQAPNEQAPNEQAPNEQAGGKPDGLPLPRFVSLRADSVNLRVGPSARYPIEWIYVRRDLPVEIIAEFDTWRRIKDPAGTEGWVHSSMLSGKRTAVVTGEVRPLLRNMENKPDAKVDLVATLEPGVVVVVERCPQGIAVCRVEVGGVEGWLSRDALWGVYPSEVIN